MSSILKAFLPLLLAGGVTLASCGDSTNNSTTSEDTTLAGNNGMDNMTADDNDDQDFLEDAVEANTMEMRALMMGEQKGGNEVKSHASHMMADHRKLGEDVAAYIASKNITLNDVDTNDTDNSLQNKAAGKEFDKAWADKMVDDHEKVIRMFEEGEREVRDPELKTMITNALPKLRSHLDMSKQLQEKMK